MIPFGGGASLEHDGSVGFDRTLFLKAMVPLAAPRRCPSRGATGNSEVLRVPGADRRPDGEAADRSSGPGEGPPAGKGDQRYAREAEAGANDLIHAGWARKSCLASDEGAAPVLRTGCAALPIPDARRAATVTPRNRGNDLCGNAGSPMARLSAREGSSPRRSCGDHPGALSGRPGTRPPRQSPRPRAPTSPSKGVGSQSLQASWFWANRPPTGPSDPEAFPGTAGFELSPHGLRESSSRAIAESRRAARQLRPIRKRPSRPHARLEL